jgi:hypothetical protein
MKKFLFSAICAGAMFYTTSYQANATPPAYDIFVLSCGSVQVEFDFEPSVDEMLFYYDLLEEMFCG